MGHSPAKNGARVRESEVQDRLEQRQILHLAQQLVRNLRNQGRTRILL